MKTEYIVRPPESRMLKSGRVRLSPWESVGWHVTKEREELIVVLRGTATVLEQDTRTVLNQGETRFITSGVSHNVRNDGQSDLEYIYVVSLFGYDKC